MNEKIAEIVKASENGQCVIKKFTLNSEYANYD